MLERGLTTETIKTFGVGFYSGKGSMTGRVVIPIHNELGELVAYCGRSVDGGEPKYMLPSGFHKSEILYNLHRVKGGGVIVVEGFFDCMKVCQSGYPNVVALMGSSMSAAQEKLLCSRFQKVTILLDGDEAGKRGAEEIASRLVKKLYVRIVELQDGKQPDGMTAEELGNLLQ